jgi:hypothetical protein
MWAYRAAVLALASAVPVLAHCSSSGGGPPSQASDDGGPDCYPDNDCITNLPATVDLVVDDTGFYAGSADSGADTDGGMKTVITTQNRSPVVFTLTNVGTMPHGFTVGCTSVLSVYPDLPAGCSSRVCFPADATIPPLEPGTSKTVTFETPAPDNLGYPFKSNAPGDANNPALNGSDGTAWSLM